MKACQRLLPNNIGPGIFLGLIFMGFLSCATLSEKQCTSANWYSIGLKDGLDGHSVDRLTRHSAACEDYGVSPSIMEYEKGRNEGLKTYCVPENGFQLGKQGKRYQQVCPRDLELLFLGQYQIGREIYEIDHRVTRINNEVIELQNKLDLEKDDEKRRLFRRRITELTMEKDRLQRQITILETKREK